MIEVISGRKIDKNTPMGNKKLFTSAKDEIENLLAFECRIVTKDSSLFFVSGSQIF